MLKLPFKTSEIQTGRWDLVIITGEHSHIEVKKNFGTLKTERLRQVRLYLVQVMSI